MDRCDRSIILRKKDADSSKIRAAYGTLADPNTRASSDLKYNRIPKEAATCKEWNPYQEHQAFWRTYTRPKPATIGMGLCKAWKPRKQWGPREKATKGKYETEPQNEKERIKRERAREIAVRGKPTK
jgi:hypothetical protein